MRIKRRKPKYIKGNYLIQDDLTGEIIRRSEARKLWNGNLTAAKNFEIRNPQDFIQTRPEREPPREVRPRTEDYITTPITADDL